MRWTVGLDHPMGAECLGHGGDSMMLYMAGLDMLRVACDEWHVLALFILQADLPTGEKLRSGLHTIKPGILEWSLELTAYDIFKAIVGDDMVVSALVLDRDGLLHQAAFFELVAVDKRATEAPLLVGRQALSKVGIYFTRRVRLAHKRTIESGVLVLVVRVVDIITSLGHCGPGAFLALALCTT